MSDEKPQTTALDIAKPEDKLGTIEHLDDVRKVHLAVAACVALSPADIRVSSAWWRVADNIKANEGKTGDIVKGLLSCLMDGLQYGNWPMHVESDEERDSGDDRRSET